MKMDTLLSTAVTVCLALLCVRANQAQICPVSPSCTVDGVLYTANLLSGTRINYLTLPNQVHPTLQDFSVVEKVPLSKKFSGSTCDWEGVLNITLPSAINGTQNRALKFEFIHDTAPMPLGFLSFHIGDSESNKADGSGCGITSHCAQVFNDDNSLVVEANREPGHPVSPPPFATEPNFITQKVDIMVGDKFIVAENLNQLKKDYCSEYLFSLDGDSPQVGEPDYNVYLGMNRLIEEPSRQHRSPGKGLCHVEVLALTCTSVDLGSDPTLSTLSGPW